MSRRAVDARGARATLAQIPGDGNLLFPVGMESQLRYWHLMTVVGWLSLGPDPARAQLLGGEALDEQTSARLAGLSVYLLRHVGDSVAIVDSAGTDAQGLFLLVAPGPGAYQLVFASNDAVLSEGPIDTIADASAVLQRRYLVPITRIGEQSVFYEFEVEKPALAISGSGAPTYPRDLKSRNVEGRVVVSLVVDVNGRAEPNTFRAISSSHPGFTSAVRQALLQMRFVPASIAGIPVRQRVVQVFEFRMDMPRWAPPPG